jgi:hypothetical protein
MQVRALEVQLDLPPAQYFSLLCPQRLQERLLRNRNRTRHRGSQTRVGIGARRCEPQRLVVIAVSVTLHSLDKWDCVAREPD